MTATPLNEAMFRPNKCFGCGPDNPDGMQIRVFRDGDHNDRLLGTYLPRPLSEGFEGIVHGGLQFTALDCMAAWLCLALRSTGPQVPLTKTSTVRYLRPARSGTTLHLTSQITQEPASPREPYLIRACVLDATNTVLTECDFEYLLMPADKFLKVVGIDELPEQYHRHFARNA